GLGRIESGRSHRIADDVFDLLREYEAAGTPCAIATVVRCEAPTSAHPGDKAVITVDGRLRGWIGGSCSEPVVRREALRTLAEGSPQLIHIVGGDEVKQTRKRGELMIATTCQVAARSISSLSRDCPSPCSWFSETARLRERSSNSPSSPDF